MKAVSAVATLFLVMFNAPVFAHGDHGKPLTEVERKASEGIFNDKDVKDRPLSDWQGVWQSVDGYLLAGDLDPVLQKKADKQGVSVDNVREYYKKGYATDVSEIGIENNVIDFHQGESVKSCAYHYDGYKILTYASGKKGVRYLFSCQDDKSGAPKFIQFSDHTIAPRQALHYHLFMGNQSHEALLKEMDNWPTYYPYNLTKAQVVDEMLHH